MRPEQRDETRLPRWVQRELSRLRRDITYYQEKVSAGPENSRVFADPFSDHATPLGEAPVIEFRLKQNERRWLGAIQCRLYTDHKGETWLDISGGDSLIIKPRSGNGIQVKTENH